MTENFLWGVATSAYQIEGAPENDWTEWKRLGRLKQREVRCGAASGHRKRWRQDLALLPAIGANAYRYSIDWSRLEPRPGEFDTAALELESERAGFLRARGIEPVIMLLHYTHPAWFWRARLGEQGQRRLVSPSRGDGRCRPAGRPHVGHGQ